jgi:hypothetical protein
MKKIAPMLHASCVIATLFAIAASAAPAQEAVCLAPARNDAPPIGTEPASLERVRNYQPIFQQCRNGLNHSSLAIRKMTIGAEGFLLMVDPSTLATHLEVERCWTCADTDDEAQKDTRFMRAVQMPSQLPLNQASPRAPLFNAGLSHGTADGSYITGDLCPSRKPLDRGFLDMLKTIGPRTPIALSITGLWLKQHGSDFQWLRKQAQAGAVEITWVNHSYHHPYLQGRPPAGNFLLMPGFDMQTEILDTERLLIANGETPSIFFRFPGLISDASLMETVRADHLIVLGADGWLVFGPPLRHGAILLVHPNGNEHEGLRLFSRLLDKGKLPRPFRPINEAP